MNKNKNIKDLFEATTPDELQREKMLNKLLKAEEEMMSTKRVNFSILLAAAIAICLITTTALASTYIRLDEMFLSFLHPINDEQADQISGGAYVINKQVKNNDSILDIKSIIGDRHLTYIVMDFTAPEGTILNASEYRFAEDYFDIDNVNTSAGWGYRLLEDENTNDNKISLVMKITTPKPVVGNKMKLHLENLYAVEPMPEEFNTMVKGKWETSFMLNFEDSSTVYEVNKEIAMLGYTTTLKNISVSPISIAIKLDNAPRKMVEAAFDATAGTELDTFPITINYRDGTSETTAVNNGHSEASGNGSQQTITTIKVFEKMINNKEIKSITFFGEEILLK